MTAAVLRVAAGTAMVLAAGVAAAQTGDEARRPAESLKVEGAAPSFGAVKPSDVIPHPPELDPLSSMVAVWVPPGDAMDIGELVRMRVDQVVEGTLPDGVVFPLENTSDDTFRQLAELSSNVLVKWFDPLTPDNSQDAPRFGSNCDYIAYFGEGWDADWAGGVVGSAPQFNGSGSSAWIWSNHEYISNGTPSAFAAPTGQHLTHAKYLVATGEFDFDVEDAAQWTQDRVDQYVRFFKRELGGAWFRAFQSPETGEWRVFRDPNAKRYDGTDNTRLRLMGHELAEPDNDDDGNPLSDGEVVGITGDCSGGQTPWGTVITAEENVQAYYGDLETAWDGNQKFILGAGFDPGVPVTPAIEASTASLWGQISNPNERHNRDVYGYLSHIDPGVDPGVAYTSINDGGDGVGHLKLGSMGRARWENATIAVEGDWTLADGQPIVIYSGNDRRSGRIYKWYSNGVYQDGMTKPEVRALLDDGRLFVAHLEDLDAATGNTLFSTGMAPTEDARGVGRWIEMSVDSTDTPVNAAALGQPGITVGEALQSNTWNNIGGFPTTNDVEKALFTAAHKIGVSELNRPEDLEWNPNDPSGTPRIYIAFTNHERQVALTQDGVLYDPDEHAVLSPDRTDDWGQIWVIEEDNPANPAASDTFTYWEAWKGQAGPGMFDAANPDNLAIDDQGGVWFGTDGNFGEIGGTTADAVYYLDLDPSHKAGEPGVLVPTFGLGFRVAAVPSDAEATGPAFSSDMRTLFVNVQHPGEFVPSTWPPRP